MSDEHANAAAHDPLEALLRLRRHAVDEARRDLASCLRVEAEATQAVAMMTGKIEAETEAAASLASEDADVEAFANWLRRIKPQQAAVQHAQENAEADTTQARSLLAAARAAARAVEVMLERQAAERLAETERREQAALDEVAQRREPT